MNNFDFEIQNLIEIHSEFHFLEKVDHLSRVFLGRVYLNGALGEGEEGEFDQNPLYRLDAFDCVTYINTVLALSSASNLIEFQQAMKKINYYHGDTRYEKRFHFMCIDWNRENQNRGLLKDITFDVVDKKGNPIALLASTIIDRPNWFFLRQRSDIKLKKASELEIQNKLNRLRSLSNQFKAEKSELFYLPLDQLFDAQLQPKLDIFAQMSHGSLIEIVRPNWNLFKKIGTHLNISHVGFLYLKEQELYFRHASQVGQVCEEPLIAYLKKYLNNPTVKGINIQKINCQHSFVIN